jgi:hypothetical protein
MNFVDALNALITHGVESELVATSGKDGESIVILTDEWMPERGFAAHAAYGVTPGGVIRGCWLLEDDGNGFEIVWGAQFEHPMSVPLSQFHIHHAGLTRLNERLLERLSAAD